MRLVKWTNVIAVALVAAGCAGGEQKAAPPPPPRPVDAVRMTPSEVRETADYLGSLLSRRNVNVLPQVAGYVHRIHVRPGQTVKAGETLLEIDARQETAALESAQAARQSAQANLELARQTLQRTEALYAEGLASAQELERARAQQQSSHASLSAADAQVSQRRVQLQFYAVRAPFEGVVGEVRVRLGDFVTATTPLTSIAHSDALELSVAIPSERARKLPLGTPVEILDASGQVLLTSSIFYVAPQADPRTQLVEVKAAFRNTVGLRPNELVRTRIVYSTRPALQIPALAVVRQSGQAFALGIEQKDGGTFVSRRPITLGPLGERAYVVEHGLAEGDLIAVSSIQTLRDGAPVQVKLVEGESAPATEARMPKATDAVAN